MKKTLYIYLEHKKLNLDVMSPKDRQWAIDFITKFCPTYFDKPC